MDRDRLAAVLEGLREALRRLVDAVTVRDAFFTLDLTVPDARTSGAGGAVGWRRRPPAVVACPECGAGMAQRRSDDEIECPDCWASFESGAFHDLELESLACPRCRTPMDHGVRHPTVVEEPQWATCPNCRYHWELAHAF